MSLSFSLSLLLLGALAQVALQERGKIVLLRCVWLDLLHDEGFEVEFEGTP